ncbi:MAG: flagellar biosynthetic protein FliR [Bdellovibrionota bacterium]
MILQITPELYIKAAICLLRVGAIIFALPLYGETSVPLKVKLMLSIAISICIYGTLDPQWNPRFNEEIWSLAGIVLKEVFIGLTLGFVARLFFEGTIMAASLVGYQMGFGTANLLVPDAQIQASSFTAMHRIIVILIFFSLNLHHIFFQAMAESFAVIPAGAAIPNVSLAHLLIEGTAAIFSIALKLAAPILVALLFTMAALGLIARTVPQLNVFTMSFPISFFVGLFIYIATSPYLIQWLKTHFLESSKYLYLVIQGLMPT